MKMNARVSARVEEDKVLLLPGELMLDCSDELNCVLERSSLVAKRSFAWARDSLIRLPVRLTLENVGVFALLLAFILPRSLAYLLIYPPFRLVFGTLYPAYASYKAVRTKNVKEYVKWMMYWIVFALFTCAETFTDVFFSFWFPFYYEIKIILVLWLLSPATKGSSILYRRFVHPALCRRETEIDEALARATEQGYSAVLQLGSKGVNYATTVLMQTAIKRGGGLVQQLRKSYSLSDLTGEKEDENCNSERSPDEVDHEEPRRRERSGRRGYSPRRTQSSSNRVEMCFSEDGEPMCSLTNIKSSDDISSGYSSGEVLKPKRSSIASERAVRHKPRMASKKPAEDEEYVGKLKVDESQVIGSILRFLAAEENFEILTYLSQQQESRKMIEYNKDEDNLSNSDDESSTLKAELTENEEKIDDQSLSLKTEPLESEEKIDDKSLILKAELTKDDGKIEEKTSIVVMKCEEEKEKGIVPVNNDSRSDRLDNQLHVLIQSANKCAASLITCNDQSNWHLFDMNPRPNISRSSSDCTLSERAGKYHKKPAPKAPENFHQKGEKDGEEDEEEEVEALKATLVIKSGSVKSFTNSEPVDATEVKRRNKSHQVKNAARESFSKLLTIPKSMFHNAFHKDKCELDKSTESNISFSSPVDKNLAKDKAIKSSDQEAKCQISDEKENSPLEKKVTDV